MFKFADQPISVMEILTSGFKAYKELFAKIWHILVLYAIITSVFALTVQKIIPSNTTITGLTKIPSDQLLKFWVLSLVFFLLYSFVIFTLMHRIFTLLKKTETPSTVGSSILAVLKKYISLIIASIIIAIITLAGLVVYFIPGILLLILFIFTIPSILFDNKRAFGGIKSGIKLMWGYYWRCFFVMLLPLILIFAENYLLILLPPNAITIISGNILNAIFLALAQIYVLLQYNDLRLRKSIPLQKTE